MPPQIEKTMTSLAKLMLSVVSLLGFSCSTGTPEACFPSHHPEVTTGPDLRHFPVARQGSITGWLTSDHRRKGGDWLYAPDGSGERHRIIGEIRAGAMPVGHPHDGAFLLTDSYQGPVFPLWEGREAEAMLYTGRKSGWVRVLLYQESARSVNTWLRLPGGMKAGGWSGHPLVIGDPSRPEAVAGAMWYKSTNDPTLGGATSTALLSQCLRRLNLASFVRSTVRPAGGADLGGE